MTDHAQALGQRIDERTARIGIIGLGYVGLPTAVAFGEAGFTVVGIDRDRERTKGVNEGRSHVEDVSSESLAALVSAGKLTAVERLADAEGLDVIDICVPTPLDKSRDPDVSAILSVVDDLRRCMHAGQLIVLTSTTYPGTTVELLKPVADSLGLVVGTDIFIAFAPERIDPGNSTWGMRNTPKVLGGITPACGQLAGRAFGTIVDTIVPVSSPTAAETVKLLENTFRSVNIALANEVAIMCRYLELDVWEVINAAATKPYGFMPFFPGPGLGGHCIPVDPSYLSWKLRRLNYHARFIGLADDINQHMPEYVVGRAAEILNDQGKSVRKARVLILGVAYKPDIGDLRESPALDLIGLLRRRGAEVVYADPHVPGPIEVEGGPLSAVDVSAELLRQQDLVLITTPHRAFDWDLIADHAGEVLDTRGWRRGERPDAWHML
jgi:UDP-N-acetyl-D-glucosamine dehydrogenase